MTKIDVNELMKAPRCLAPKGWNAARLMKALRADPYQTRTSSWPVPVRHTRLNRSGYISEFVEDVAGEHRIAIETTDAIVFLSRLENSALGVVFVPIGAITTKEILEKNGKEPTIIRG